MKNLFQALILLFINGRLLMVKAQQNLGQCTGQQQREIYGSKLICEMRETLLDMKKFIANDSSVIKIMPEFVKVNTKVDGNKKDITKKHKWGSQSILFLRAYLNGITFNRSKKVKYPSVPLFSQTYFFVT